MKATKQPEGEEVQTEAAGSVRASVTFPPDVYRRLEEIAKKKKVSLAWVVRDAAEQYIADKWPLLEKQGT